MILHAVLITLRCDGVSETQAIFTPANQIQASGTGQVENNYAECQRANSEPCGGAPAARSAGVTEGRLLRITNNI